LEVSRIVKSQLLFILYFQTEVKIQDQTFLLIQANTEENQKKVEMKTLS